jgi:N-acetyl-gamma-glutamyl-phosphate reductase
MARGILATCSAPLAPDVTSAEVREAYLKAYDTEPFVHVLPEGEWPQTQAVLGSNSCHLQVTVDVRAGRLVAVGAIDNLAKGTAGGAIQCMNLALGLDETLGLPSLGLAP